VFPDVVDSNADSIGSPRPEILHEDIRLYDKIVQRLSSLLAFEVKFD
jgi:hypothetical protein